MKLAEALILRADTQRQVEQLRERLMRSVQVQEGDAPPENPQTLLNTLDNVFDQLQTLIQKINRTNASTSFGDDSKTLSDALVQRDSLLARRSTLNRAVEMASNNQHRYGRSEIKFVVTVDIVELQKDIDRLSREFRELDTAIQQLNWTVDLAD